jgi:hypothetical protein
MATATEPCVRCVLTSAFLALALLSGCSEDSSGQNGTRVIPGDQDAADIVSQTFDAGQILPDAAILPDCLQGDSPSGCAVAPNLPDCLQGDSPLGCAAPPQLNDWTCPAGWNSEVIGTGEPWSHAICKPPDTPQCPYGEAAWPGDTACQRMGTSCPSTGFLDEPTIRAQAPGFNGKLIYASPGAAGDGSLNAPFGKISEALAAAGSGDIVALSKAEFAEDLSIASGVAVVGACVGGTTISSATADESAAVVDITATGALIANLRIGGPRMGVRIAASGGTTVLASIEVKGAIAAGILVESAGVTSLQSVTVRDTAGTPSTGETGMGLFVTSGVVQASRLALERNRRSALRLDGALADVTADHALLSKTIPQESDQKQGGGVQVVGGARLSLSASVIEQNTSVGLSANGAGCKVGLTDVTIRNTRSRPVDGMFGRGVEAANGAKIDAARTLVEGNQNLGVLSTNPDTHISLTNCVIRETVGRDSDKAGGDGLWAQEGGSADVTRTALLSNHDTGITVIDSASQVAIHDVVIEDTRLQESDQSYGIGLLAQSGSSVTASSLLLARNRFVGLFASGGGTILQADDLSVRDTLAEPAGMPTGLGVAIYDGAHATLNRAVLEGNHNSGMFVGKPGAVLDASEVMVRATKGSDAPDSSSSGLGMGAGGKANVQRSLLVDNESVGIFATGAGTSLDLSDVVVRSSQPSKLMPEGGMGITGNAGAGVTARRVIVERCRNAALGASGQGTTFQLENIVVRETLGRSTDGLGGRGIELSSGAKVTLNQAVFDRNSDVGLAVFDTGTVLTLLRSLVRETLASGGGQGFGPGLTLQAGARATVQSSVFLRNGDSALLCSDSGTRIELTDCSVRDTDSEKLKGTNGEGLFVQQGAQASVQRTSFEGNRYYSITALDKDSSIDLVDVIVRNTRKARCVALDSSDPHRCVENGVEFGAGIALSATQAGKVQVDLFDLSGNAACGIQVGNGGHIDASRGSVHGNPIGVNIQEPGYDLGTVTGPTLRYYDNVTNLDTAQLPIPDAKPTLAKSPGL